ncbi:RNA polymerase sigma factor (sigma-70 family) [Catenuloplanes nepalensis]|uniref:RNA polymerase sigma factor (Sigma-70 family) n=1 Tax=Catenuloplanes nepalensis TaxID=587533 RepID=A0ABT9MN26_9ACTN|nr:sigma factor-like helix-turn-helix DNA-binding protein [Catenuloplanes nepalensis]MDP9792790.1 RNA polymerase sigma factor (sigma-70 family) [Catenuloplanes nepalensis]
MSQSNHATRWDETGHLEARYDAECNALIEETYARAEAVLRLGGDHSDLVRGALHEAYLIARRKWAQIREFEAPLGWVIKTAHNVLRRERAKAGRETALPEEMPGAPAATTDSWEAEQLRRFWLAQLPPRQAQVFELAEQGFSNPEIGRTLGLADSSVRFYKSDARRRLQELAGAADATR